MQVRDAIGYQSKGVFFGSDSDEMSISPSTLQMPERKVLTHDEHAKQGSLASFETLSSALEKPQRRHHKSSSQSKDSHLALQSALHIELAEAEATQVPLRLVSDTVR